ncbi:hypothetical protein RHS01_11445 [Rhizoctonia solani]|uniref:DDE-1 domain-containing protein n=1 Tax=Rhizoctonia solani TaxID=456999 RepID=A0A8H7M1H5_9AGAM|nr:hypothetical protein RHS01_11445 [Rhizoctonia solani]
MRLKKRSKAAKDRERLKRRRIDPCNTASDGSQYAPSSRESTDNSSDAATGDEVRSQHPKLELDRDTLCGLWELESDDVSESDGEMMLRMDDSFDENDWDPDVVPDLYPIFTEPQVKLFKSAEKALRAPVYTRKSRTTSWRRQVAAEEQAKEAETYGDIRSFFQVKKKDKLLERQTIVPADTPPGTQDDTEHIPAISYSITISDDPESPSGKQREAPTASRLSPRISSPLELASGSQNPPDWRYRSPKTLSPSLSSRPLSPLSQSPSPQPNPSKLPKRLPFENELNILALDRGPDSPTSPTLPHEDSPDVNNAPTPETPPPPSAREPEAHKTLAPLRANSPDSSVEVRLKELRKTLTSLKKQLDSEMRRGKTKIDPRDPVDIQALFDYCILAEQLVWEGLRNPEMSASLQIACTKVSTINKDGDVISKGAWYARTLRSKAKHVQDFGQLPPRKQGKGGAHVLLLDNPLVMKAVNTFVDKCAVGKKTGRLVLSDEEIKAQRELPKNAQLKTFDARKIIYPGKNHAAYWDMPQLIAQIKDAIKIFEVKFPGAQMLLFVDQSSAHNAYAADALNAWKMNVTPGGKQPIMHNTIIPSNNPNPMLCGQPQAMTFPATHPEYPNQPKGMEQILREQGLWELLVAAAGGSKLLDVAKFARQLQLSERRY